MNDDNTNPIADDDDNQITNEADDIELDTMSTESSENATSSTEIDEEADQSSDISDIEEADESESVVPAEMDVDAALAAVSQLSLLTANEDDMTDDTVSTDTDSSPIQSESDSIIEIVDDFEIPQEITMTRGQLSSILPAVTLIILGGWLTFTLTTTDTIPSAGLLLSVVLIGIGVVFLSQWLNSSRWSGGNFFIGASTALIGGIQLYLSQVAPAALNNAWALWIVAIGLALFGAGYLALPRLPRLSIMGILIIIAGGIGYVLTSGAISAEVVGFIGNLWIVGAVILGVMLLAPLLRRRNQ